MKKLYRGPYIDAFCQVWFHLAQLFQRSRLKYEKVNGRTTDGRQLMAIPHMTLHDPLGQVSLKKRGVLTSLNEILKYMRIFSLF
jgi:hypothetical protein